jgi:uncharacterized protein (UPF0276 family)
LRTLDFVSTLVYAAPNIVELDLSNNAVSIKKGGSDCNQFIKDFPNRRITQIERLDVGERSF